MKKDIQENPPTFSLILKEPLHNKMESLQAYARMNGHKVSDGLIFRALLLHTEPGPEFLGMVRQQKANERTERADLRRVSLAATKSKKSKKGEGDE